MYKIARELRLYDRIRTIHGKHPAEFFGIELAKDEEVMVCELKYTKDWHIEVKVCAWNPATTGFEDAHDPKTWCFLPRDLFDLWDRVNG